MITLTVLHEVVRDLDDAELEDWIARRWVQPEEEPDGYRFADIDVARIRLIRVLRHELLMEPGSLPVVLSLLDQLHDAHRQLRALRRGLPTP